MNQPTITVRKPKPGIAQQHFRRTFHFSQGEPLSVFLDAATNERLNADWEAAGGRRPGIGAATHSIGLEAPVPRFTYPYIPAWSSEFPEDEALHMLSVRLSDVLFIS